MQPTEHELGPTFITCSDCGRSGHDVHMERASMLLASPAQAVSHCDCVELDDASICIDCGTWHAALVDSLAPAETPFQLADRLRDGALFIQRFEASARKDGEPLGPSPAKQASVAQLWDCCLKVAGMRGTCASRLLAAVLTFVDGGCCSQRVRRNCLLQDRSGNRQSDDCDAIRWKPVRPVSYGQAIFVA